MAVKKEEQIEGLKPCPFCGGDRLYLRTWIFGRPGTGPPMLKVNCSRCRADGPPGESRAQAMKRWDERSSSSDATG